jgi:hypothetical protein
VNDTVARQTWRGGRGRASFTAVIVPLGGVMSKSTTPVQVSVKRAFPERILPVESAPPSASELAAAS